MHTNPSPQRRGNGRKGRSKIELPQPPSPDTIGPKGANGKKVTLPELVVKNLGIEVIGETPLIVHKFSKKAREQMRAKQAGEGRLPKKPKVPEEECEAALYRFSGNPKKYGIPAVAFKKAMVSACRHVEGVPMTVARGAFHVYADGVDPEGIPLVEIEGDWHMRTDIVRLESGVADIRYRPEFTEWKTRLRIRFLTSSISEAEVLNLLRVAGFAVGVGENRAEKSGDTYGQFTMPEKFSISEKPVAQA